MDEFSPQNDLPSEGLRVYTGGAHLNRCCGLASFDGPNLACVNCGTKVASN
jgi:hypothetical protein